MYKNYKYIQNSGVLNVKWTANFLTDQAHSIVKAVLIMNKHLKWKNATADWMENNNGQKAYFQE